MLSAPGLRGFAASLLALVALLLAGGATCAQTGSADLPPEKAKQFLELMNDPEVKAWLEGKAGPAAEAPDASVADAVADWQAAIQSRIGGLLAAIPRIPDEIAKAAEVAARDVNSGRPGIVILVVAVLVAVGTGAEWLVRRAMSQAETHASAGQSERTMMADTVALLTFAFSSIGSFVVFEWPPLLRKIVLTLLAAVIAFRFVRLLARVLLSGAARPEGVEDAPATRFLFGRVSLFAAILLFGWAAVSIMGALGMSLDLIRLAAYLLGLGLVATAIEIIWRRPDRTTSTVRSVLLSIFLALLWVIWVAGMPGILWVGIYGLLLPAALRSIGQLARSAAGTARQDGVLGVTVDVLVVRGARAVLIAAAVAWLAYLWRSGAGVLAGSDIGERLIGGLLGAVIVLLVADLIWQLSKSLIDRKLEVAAKAGGDADEMARAGRLRTLLPIFRNVLAVFIAVVTALSILSGLGVQIAPLIAGAGIFGVAIGFGSQTLVKDVLSGVFYMLDDAFRVGEYIQSGSYKGTVESFSLRSVRLRHHRGPVYTVPFGQLGSVQNMSRDWAIDKMTIGITYDSDVELARKLVKKIGQELAADPEFAADTLEPLKMQGIDNFGDFAVELRMKLKTKPGTQFPIKRRAFMMIKKAFAENGIKIAVPTVHVEGGNVEAAAAAQQQINKINQAAELAANTA